MSGFDICPGEEFLFTEHKPRLLPSILWDEWTPQYKQYVDYNDCLLSYKDWPLQLAQTPDRLASSGFFYTGNNDSCCCFFCGVILNKWQKDDNIFTEHKEKAPHCIFMRMVCCI